MAIVIPLKATDDDLIRIGNENPGYKVEREEDGTVTMSPTHTRTSSKTLEAGAQLRDYAKRVGGKAFGSDAGFAIGPGERLKCPDASWASPKTIASIPPEDLDRFWPVSPDVGIEVKSHTDNFADTVAKVKIYQNADRSTPSRLTPIRAMCRNAARRPMVSYSTSTRLSTPNRPKTTANRVLSRASTTV